MKKLYKAAFFSILLVIMKTSIYFISKLFVNNPILIGNEIDNHIPFIPQFVYFYYLWYAYIFLIPTILYLTSAKNYKRYLLFAIIGTLIIGSIYVIYPTTMIRANFDVNSFSTWLLNIAYNADTPALNCFPSGHCYYSFVFIFCTYNIKEIKPIYRILIIISSILICLSTLFVKQHVFIDLIGALILIIIMIPVVLLIEKKVK